MDHKMPCSITDGLQYDDWLEQDDLTEDEDAAYERYRQEQIDDEVLRDTPTDTCRR